MNEKFSYTTGTYAAAAAKAAVKNLLGENHSENVEIKLP
ncbi:MAG: cobalt-precorrin-5B (C(1))-methyltransferase, partial [Nitrospinota bacterium]